MPTSPGSFWRAALLALSVTAAFVGGWELNRNRQLVIACDLPGPHEKLVMQVRQRGGRFERTCRYEADMDVFSPVPRNRVIAANKK